MCAPICRHTPSHRNSEVRIQDSGVCRAGSDHRGPLGRQTVCPLCYLTLFAQHRFRRAECWLHRGRTEKETSRGGVYSLLCVPRNSDPIPKVQTPLGKMKAWRLRAPTSCKAERVASSVALGSCRLSTHAGHPGVASSHSAPLPGVFLIHPLISCYLPLTGGPRVGFHTHPAFLPASFSNLSRLSTMSMLYFLTQKEKFQIAG